MKRVTRLRLGATLALLPLLAGCPSSDSGRGEGGVPSAEDWTPDLTEQVREACTRCHATPKPDVLPKARWESLIPTMPSMPLPTDVKALTDEETALAKAWYTRKAPDELPWSPQASQLSTKLHFKVERFSPPDKKLLELKIPAVSNVRFSHLSDGKRKDLLITDMRTSTLMLLSPWREGKGRRIRRLGKDLAYPVHAELSDVNQDGRMDFMIASIGGMNPNNDELGRVTLMLQAKGRRFLTYTAMSGLGRVTDVRSADLDGDGDRDLIVAAFGWRGPGKLLVLENTSPDGTVKPTYTPHELDPRDGFIHVEVVDLNDDGRKDIVTVLSQEHEQVLAFVNKGRMRFKKRVLHRAPTPSWGYSGLKLADMDGDKDIDILVSNGDTLDDDLLKPYHGVSWLENVGKLKFKERRIGSLYGCERAVPADMDGDGDQDVVASAFLPQLAPEIWKSKRLDSLVWFERTGNGWKKHSLEKSECVHATLDVADYDADGKMDIAVGNFVWLKGNPDAAGKPTFQADYVTIFTQQ